jgi:hypothetical protein
MRVAHLLDRNYPMLLVRFGRVPATVPSRALRSARYVIGR